MKFISVMSPMSNWYHRYLNLPFTISPLSIFKEEGKTIKHFYINDYPIYPAEDWFNDLGIILALKEVFYTPPNSKIPIHTDHGRYTHHAKINITWGPEEGVIQWWKSDKTYRKKMLGYADASSESSSPRHAARCPVDGRACGSSVWPRRPACRVGRSRKGAGSPPSSKCP